MVVEETAAGHDVNPRIRDQVDHLDDRVVRKLGRIKRQLDVDLEKLQA